MQKTNNGKIVSNPYKGSAAYKANLEKGDVILAVNNHPIGAHNSFTKIVSESKPKAILQLKVKRYQKIFETIVVLQSDPSYTISFNEQATSEKLTHRKEWLQKK